MILTENRLWGWRLRLGTVTYEKALSLQRKLVKMRRDGMARDTIIFVEHPSIVTVGKDDNPENYKDLGIDPIQIERGGDVTYHGPGQLVVYFVFNLARRGRDLHLFMEQLQSGIINALDRIGIQARKDNEHTGVWVKKKKIASVGIAVKNWISFHGIAINLNTDIEEFKKINPCGLDAKVMTSAQKLLGKKISMDSFIESLTTEYHKIFETKFYNVKLDELAEDMESQSGGNII